MTASGKACTLSFDRPAQDVLQVRLAGDCTIGHPKPSLKKLIEQMQSDPRLRHLTFECQELSRWDSSLLTLLVKIVHCCDERQIKIHRQGLPHGVQGLLHLAHAVPERKGARRSLERPPWLARVGQHALNAALEATTFIRFIGESSLGFFNLLRGKAHFRRSDLWLIIQECGPRALPIVTLISLLVGLILAFVGALQLQMFGAQVYIANLVALGMVREMGAMMTAVIMAGRTGAAFAAQLGTMQVNEEIDALKTLGLSPMEFLVLPRLLALILMMPLLCLYADAMGIVGGALASIGLFDISLLEYAHQTRSAITLNDIYVGVIKCAVFGVLIAIAGCLRGIQSGRSAQAVGIAATSAVVTGIVFIVVADAIMTVIFNALGI